MDSSGGMTRRISVPKRMVALCFGTLLILALGFLGGGIHGLTLISTANEAQAISEDNLELNKILAGITEEIPEAQLAVLRNNETFRQVWIRCS